MAKAKSESLNIDPDADYEVRLSRPHRHGRRILSPLHQYTLKGRVLAEIPADKVASAAAAS